MSVLFHTTRLWLEKKRLTKLIMFGILILALLKLTTVVFLNPLMGYANNWDFIRQSSCVGVW